MCSQTLRIFIAVALFGISYAAESDKAMVYLSNFGYLNPAFSNPSTGALMTEEAFTKAVKEFQAFAGLNITGELDPATMEVMSLPRCGVKDIVGFAADRRSKRYALQGSRWRVRNLTYKISKYPKNLGRKDVDEEVRKAFSVWSDVTSLTFAQKNSGPVHIDIRFEKGEHGDGDPFDGPGGTLAHAFFPVYGGDAHFDDAEKWTVNSYRGTNLFQVAAHEFGHSLGLSHSDVKSALMAPFYRGYAPTFELDEDDIEAIQSLYGRPEEKEKTGPKATTTKAPKTPTENKELCQDGSIDTIFNSADKDTFAFKGDKFWKLTDDSVAPGYPKKISDSWPGLPGNIDAAFTYKNRKTYFFKGSQYWRYNGRDVDGQYPKKISTGFPGIPDNVDAAMVWGGNGKIYFFKGSKFWSFDPNQKPPVKSTYPKPISNWEGIPNDLDAALQYTNGYTYFFKNGQYYRFNDHTFSVDNGDPPFPRPAGSWWFGCTSSAGITGEIRSSPSSSINDDDDESNSRSPWRKIDEGRRGNFRADDVSDIILYGAGPPEKRTDERDQGRPTEQSPLDSSSSRTSNILVLQFVSILIVLLNKL